MNHHIIYVPGLGDGYDSLRKNALMLWNLHSNVTTELVPMNWKSEPTLDEKLQRLSAAIRRATVDGKTVSLVGESAGGSVVLLALAQNPEVHRVITLCGVANSLISVGESFRKRGPALPSAVDKLGTTNLTAVANKIHNYRAFIDHTVLKKYSLTDGATEHVVWSVSHLLTIFLCLTVFSPFLIRTLTQD